jgi:diguanylate cyclase (GGDEF)-like protein
VAPYAAGFALWLVVSVAMGVVFAGAELGEVRSEFDTYVDSVYQRLETRLQANEAVLQGMRAFLKATGSVDLDRVRAYAQAIMQRYRHIYQVQLVERVPAGQLKHFEAAQRRRGATDFSVKRFSYEGERKWVPLQPARNYYPITFMAPSRPGSAQVLGLDVGTVPALKKALEQSSREHRVVATRPFRLVEGDWAYLIFAPIDASAGSGEWVSACLVIRAQDLLAESAVVLPPGTRITVSNRTVPEGQPDRVIDYRAETAGVAPLPVFGRLQASVDLGASAQPFTLEVVRTLGWQAVATPVMYAYLAAATLALLPVLAWSRGRVRRRDTEVRTQQALYRLANYDSLTGLPNRNLYRDRLSQAMHRTRRSGRTLALLYLDLDEFKNVNDSAGHAVGDEVLKEVARRLSGQVRAEDTVARISGDEFCVVMEGVVDASTVDTMVKKLRAAFREPVHVAGGRFAVGASVGVALYPRDGDTADALMRRADADMYRNKRGGR